MSQDPLCPNLSQKVQAEVSQMANCNLSRMILLGGLSVNLNHLKTNSLFLVVHHKQKNTFNNIIQCPAQFHVKSIKYALIKTVLKIFILEY